MPATKLARWLKDHAAEYRTQREFAAKIGVSEGRLSQILAGAKPSPQLAVRIETATNGAVHRSIWHPELWSEPKRRAR